jgi:stearoyl-CoA desaturase (Delta-9 desaturase)
MHVLRDYTRSVILPVVRAELASAGGRLSGGIKKLLVREPALLNENAKTQLKDVLAANRALHTVHEFRAKLQVLWNGSHMSNETLLQHLKEWITQAETSGIKALQDFAIGLRAYTLQPAAA